MKVTIRLFLLILFFISIHKSTIAQKRNFNVSTTLGLNLPLLDDGLGFHIGINPAYSLTNYVALESQLSLAVAKIDGSFISGEQDSQSNFNLLFGGRIYFISPEKKTRPYFNLLLGGTFNQESDFQEYLFGFSSGVYVDINRFLVGLTFEVPGNVIIKAGYVF